MVCAPGRRDNPRALAGAQTMHYLTCTTISSVDLAYYGVSRVKIGYLLIVVQVMATIKFSSTRATFYSTG